MELVSNIKHSIQHQKDISKTDKQHIHAHAHTNPTKTFLLGAGVGNSFSTHFNITITRPSGSFDLPVSFGPSSLALLGVLMIWPYWVTITRPSGSFDDLPLLGVSMICPSGEFLVNMEKTRISCVIWRAPLLETRLKQANKRATRQPVVIKKTSFFLFFFT